MYYSGDERAKELALYIIEHNSTVRKTAEVYKISKSTVNKDIAYRLKNIDIGLYNDARKVLDKNLSERHIRGGEATKKKYLEIKNIRN